MRRRNVDAILGADFHLRDSSPRCRTDDYLETQKRKIAYVKELQQKYNCPILHAGDLFDKWNNNPSLLYLAIADLPSEFISIPGNHDLPRHRSEYLNESSIGVLGIANRITLTDSYTIGKRRILMLHQFVWNEKRPSWIKDDSSAAMTLLKKYKEYDVILTGDNHETFVVQYKGRVLVNPGSLMRMDADQEHHKPVVFFYNAEQNTVAPHYIPIADGVVSREHLEDAAIAEKLLGTFFNNLSEEATAVEGIMGYEQALGHFLSSTRVSKKVRHILNEVLENARSRITE